MLSSKGFAFCFFIFTAIFSFGFDSPKESVNEARSVLIQHNGRVQSLQAFSEEIVQEITGKANWNKRPAVDWILESLAKEEETANIPWVRLDYPPILEELGLSSDRHFFSYTELLAHADLIESVVRKVQEKRDKDIRPEKIEQKYETLFTQLMTVKGLITGQVFLVIPSSETEHWQTPYATIDPKAPIFRKMIAAYKEKQWTEFSGQMAAWKKSISEATQGAYDEQMKLELLYLNHKPFQKSWILYLAAFIFLSFLARFPFSKPIGLILVLAAFIEHTLGLTLRVLILGRPPVSNMYESMIYMNWALVLFAGIFAAARKSINVLSIASLLSATVMIYASLLPLDAGLEVLVPVLRSNYWLTIHVLTIVSSYGAFGLAMGLGHRHLILSATKKFNKKTEESSGQTIYRVIQLGTLLVGVGTFLGGVWANESWGRFWGWDPKETWALITFLGYLIVVHLRATKKLDNFWLAMSSIIGFLLVLMTWYGVNFVLGRGLHSYGQGAGGMQWVIYFLIFESVFTALAFWKHYSKN